MSVQGEGIEMFTPTVTQRVFKVGWKVLTPSPHGGQEALLQLSPGYVRIKHKNL